MSYRWNIDLLTGFSVHIDMSTIRYIYFSLLGTTGQKTGTVWMWDIEALVTLTPR